MLAIWCVAAAAAQSPLPARAPAPAPAPASSYAAMLLFWEQEHVRLKRRGVVWAATEAAVKKDFEDVAYLEAARERARREFPRLPAATGAMIDGVVALQRLALAHALVASGRGPAVALGHLRAGAACDAARRLAARVAGGYPDARAAGAEEGGSAAAPDEAYAAHAEAVHCYALELALARALGDAGAAKAARALQEHYGMDAAVSEDLAAALRRRVEQTGGGGGGAADAPGVTVVRVLVALLGAYLVATGGRAVLADRRNAPLAAAAAAAEELLVSEESSEPPRRRRGEVKPRRRPRPAPRARGAAAASDASDASDASAPSHRGPSITRAAASPRQTRRTRRPGTRVASRGPRTGPSTRGPWPCTARATRRRRGSAGDRPSSRGASPS